MLRKVVERGKHAVIGNVMRCPGCKCLVAMNSYQDHVFFCGSQQKKYTLRTGMPFDLRTEPLSDNCVK